MPLIYGLFSNEFDATAALRFYGSAPKLGTASSGWFPYSVYNSQQSQILSDPNNIFTVQLNADGSQYFFTLDRDITGYTIEAEIVANTLSDTVNLPLWFSAKIIWSDLTSSFPLADPQYPIIDVLEQGVATPVGTTGSVTLPPTSDRDSLVFMYRTDTNTTRGDIDGYVDVLIRLRGYRNYSPTS